MDFLLSRGSPLFRFGITGEKEAGYIVPKDGTRQNPGRLRYGLADKN